MHTVESYADARPKRFVRGPRVRRASPQGALRTNMKWNGQRLSRTATPLAAISWIVSLSGHILNACVRSCFAQTHHLLELEVFPVRVHDHVPRFIQRTSHTRTGPVRRRRSTYLRRPCTVRLRQPPLLPLPCSLVFPCMYVYQCTLYVRSSPSCDLDIHITCWLFPLVQMRLTRRTI